MKKYIGYSVLHRWEDANKPPIYQGPLPAIRFESRDDAHEWHASLGVVEIIDGIKQFKTGHISFEEV